MHSCWSTKALGLILCCLLGPSSTWAAPAPLSSPSSELPEIALLNAGEEGPVKIVLRGEKSAPDKVQEQGGLIPRSWPPQKEAYSLYNHQIGSPEHVGSSKKNTVYVSTTTSTQIAWRYAGTGYIYIMHATPNFIDLNESFLKKRESIHTDEAEYSAMGGVLYDQILGWIKVTESYDGTTSQMTNREWWEAHQGEFQPNPDYRPYYNDFSASGPQPQLVYYEDYGARKQPPYNQYTKTVEEYAIEFMNENGAAVGWNGTFPLFGPKFDPLLRDETVCPNDHFGWLDQCEKLLNKCHEHLEKSHSDTEDNVRKCMKILVENQGADLETALESS